ncbi:MAG TPA: hypothetical protein EYP14_02020 [Planctomycetaceae bacterium]|nr:hypothetical protein [Planctomycetaceae bacterium]
MSTDREAVAESKTNTGATDGLSGRRLAQLLAHTEGVPEDPSLQAAFRLGLLGRPPRGTPELLESAPDRDLPAGLRGRRSRGRNDYDSVPVFCGILLVTIMLQRHSTAPCLAELRRNPSLRRSIEVETESNVPTDWNMFRFLRLRQSSILEGVQ